MAFLIIYLIISATRARLT